MNEVTLTPLNQDLSVSMETAKATAKKLVKFVKENRLSANIAGKDYLMVEAWQFAGALMNLTPIIKEVLHVAPESLDGKEFKYSATAEIFNDQGILVGRGFAICSNKESKKKVFDEYAIASMAQTRAIGKAFRNKLAWIVRMAGYEATPAEEINKDVIEDDLRKAKGDVLKALTEAKITDSTKMISYIEKTIGKGVIENIDDAQKVIAQLEADKENKED